MNVKESKLFNQVGAVLKTLTSIKKEYDVRKVTVDYRINKLEADIHWPPGIENTGNGIAKWYNWEMIDALKEVSDKYGITYLIGQNDKFELLIQIQII